jgi:hypothetical protein
MTTTRAAKKTPTNDNANQPQRMHIEWVALDVLQTWPGNPKEHDEELLGSSFARFGFVDPIIFDELTKRIVAGHGRRKKLWAMYTSGQPVPDRVEVRASDGMWLVPVLRGIAFKTEHEAEAYLLVNNQSTMRRGYNELALAEMLERHRNELEQIGWDQKEADDLFARVEKMTQGGEVEVPEDFKEFDAGEKPGHNCPQCGFRVTCDR